jgi:hypothetical protein
MSISTITSHQIEVGNLDSRPNNKKYGEKNEREACQLNLHPIIAMVVVSPNFKYGPCGDHTS